MTFQLRNTEIGLILREWALFGRRNLIWANSSSSESSSGPAAKKKCQAGGKLRKLPVGITASSKGALEVVHERFQYSSWEITRHIKGPIYQRFKDSSSTKGLYS